MSDEAKDPKQTLREQVGSLLWIDGEEVPEVVGSICRFIEQREAESRAKLASAQEMCLHAQKRATKACEDFEDSPCGVEGHRMVDWVTNTKDSGQDDFIGQTSYCLRCREISREKAKAVAEALEQVIALAGPTLKHNHIPGNPCFTCRFVTEIRSLIPKEAGEVSTKD